MVFSFRFATPVRSLAPTDPCGFKPHCAAKVSKHKRIIFSALEEVLKPVLQLAALAVTLQNAETAT